MKILSILLLAPLLAGCSGAAQTPTPATPPITSPAAATAEPASTPDAYFLSDGGGEPRTAGYWLLWNSCAPENKAETARANGGRAAGWILLDDLLAYPGINLGTLKIERCAQALELLQGRSLNGEPRDNDLAFSLAAELLTAYFNLEAGAESCLGVVETVLGAHSLLTELGFDGEQALLGPGNPAVEPRAEAELYLYALQQYNRGDLCR